MRIVSLVLRIAPPHLDVARQALADIPGVQVHAADAATGKLIITVEDGPDHSTADSILAAHKIPYVLSATLAYEYGEDDAPSANEPSSPHRPPALGAPSCH
ncbi:chaperone NapD [Bordetella sp. BOR01]|uniref:chaperone NapD n=1 Tax=Bordetella sp. BOR01 TaxID=2854779 RepID=UPI001C4809FA|nr:chaperone NapD [Bordetella sp. BOR01]MBV7483585.1 chaperone NapD [Bordetella sp. BOR01]